MTRYTITVFAGGNQYTAYEGSSYTAANKAVCFARSILIMTGGSATIAARYDGAAQNPLYVVTQGAAQARALLQEVK
jgi:hypothetical protein